MHTHGLFLNALKLDYPHPGISVPAFFTIDGFPQALERNLGHCEIPLGSKECSRDQEANFQQAERPQPLHRIR